jgi:23S rRNA (cytidine1920-2'-O)/16S rRNA (cytidine1409-2'-O)-methyltransferase
LLLPIVKNWLSAEADVVPLIKPQFEAGKQDVGKGGVVKSPEVHRRVLVEVLSAAQSTGFSVAGLIRSPLKGPAGNIEFLAQLHYEKGETLSLTEVDMQRFDDMISPLIMNPL